MPAVGHGCTRGRVEDGLSRRLTLAYRDDHWPLGTRNAPLDEDPTLQTILTTAPPWPDLEYLSLSVDITNAEHFHFYELLTPPLRSLELHHLRVDDIPELLRSIPKILNLQHVFLQNLWSTNWDRSEKTCEFWKGTDFAGALEDDVKAYLLRQSDELPELPLDPLCPVIRFG